jgi:hypothetical protein
MKLDIGLLALPLACASCTSASVIPRLGQLNLDGHLGINDAGSGLSATNDLGRAGLQDDKSVLNGRVDLEAGGMHTTFEISDSSHDGSGTLDATVSDGTTTIPAGTAVNSELSVLMGEAMVTWDLVPGDTVELGLGLGASMFGVDARFTAPSTGDTIATKQVVPIPVLAARAGVDLGRFDVSALLGGLKLNTGGKDASFFDLDLMARLKLFGVAGKRIGAIVAGYRYVDLKVDYEASGKRVDAEVQLSGPYLGFSLGF